MSPRRSSAAMHDVLGGLALFSGLSERSVLVLTQTCRLRSIDKAEILFFQTDAAEAAYVLRSGRISLLLSNADGRFLVLDDMRPGEIFGELGVLTGQPHSASALARADSEVLVIPRAALLRLVQDEPQFARTVLEITAVRLQKSVERQQSLAFMNAQARLARYLLSLDAREQDERPRDDVARGSGKRHGADPPDGGEGARRLAAQRMVEDEPGPRRDLEPQGAGGGGAGFVGLTAVSPKRQTGSGGMRTLGPGKRSTLGPKEPE